MAVTLKTIAERTGVSYQTVWRALHDETDISKETKDQIRAVAEELNYRPNRLAATLRTSRSKTIGLIVLDVSNAFTGAVAKGIEYKAAQLGYSVLLANSDGSIEREREAVLSLIERRVDGLIISSSDGDNSYLSKETPEDFPIVAINRPLTNLNFSYVKCNNYQVGMDAVAHLVARGHSRIGGIFGPFANTPFQERHDGLLAGLAAVGVQPHADWLATGPNNSEYAEQAFMAMWSRPDRPTGLFTCSYRLTEGVLRALDTLKVQRGSDLELIGFDIQYATLLDPPLTVFKQPVEAITSQAVNKIIGLIEGKQNISNEVLDISLLRHPGR